MANTWSCQLLRAGGGWVGLGVATTLGLLGLMESCSSAVAETNRPNILVILTDDHGWADLGVQGMRDDVRTPNLDALARDGVRFQRGYVSAPVCVPSRAGLLTGRASTRFGMEHNNHGPLPTDQRTMANWLKDAGYVTGMVGKWHVAGSKEIVEAARRSGRKDLLMGDCVPVNDANLPGSRGFDEYFCGAQRNYAASFDLSGQTIANAPRLVVNNDFRVEVQTEAALAFLKRQGEKPFFLFVSYFAPHVPLEAPDKYQARFAHIPDPTRRTALAMVAAMDDGIGQIRQVLRARGWETNTLIFFLADNGAPTKPGTWDGSLNHPLLGEKGMLTDGGIRVPFLAAWPGTLPAGKVYASAVSSLDILPTALAAAQFEARPEKAFDGVNLLPFLTGKETGAPHEALFWRFRSQAAVLAGRWQLYFVAPDRWRLYDTETVPDERRDVSAQHPEIVAQLQGRLHEWCAAQNPPGLPTAANVDDNTFVPLHELALERGTAIVPSGIRVVGDWEIEVVATNHGPGELRGKFSVAPPQSVNITNDLLPQLDEWKTEPGWARQKVPGLSEGLNCARFVLDERSVVARSSLGADATVFEAGKDFRVDVEWCGIGRVSGGRIGSNQPVYLSYRFQKRRLDSVVLNRSGQLELRRGEPHISMPAPPALAAGEVRVANLFVPENLKKLGPANFFPILETQFPEPPKVSPSAAERLLPKTVAKLRDGKPVKILAWGDSVTQGYLGEDQWQNQFVRRLQQRFPQAQIELITRGWGAHNSQHFLDAPPGHAGNFAERVLGAKPDLVVSEFVNDVPLDVAKVEQNYRKFLADFRAIGAEWIILSPHYSTFMNWPSERDLDDDPRAYVKMLRRFAPENQVALADAAARYGQLWRQGIPYSTLMVNTVNHPDVRGMAIFADSLMALFP